MSLLNKFLSSRNTWTIFVGMLFVWIGFSGLGTMLGPKNPGKIFLMYLIWVSCSYLGAAVIVKIFSKIIGLKFSFRNLYIDLFWVFVLSLGSLFFCFFFQNTIPQYGTPVDFTSILTGVFSLSFFPSFIFRIITNLIISAQDKPLDSKASITPK